MKLNPRVIAFTSQCSPMTVQTARLMGFQGFVRKTDQLDELLFAIKCVGCGRNFYSPHAVDSERPEIPIHRILTPREIRVLRVYGKTHSVERVATILRKKRDAVAKLRYRATKKLASTKRAIEEILEELGINWW